MSYAKGDDRREMLHHLFFVMSLSGSVVVILYGLTYHIAQRFFPFCWRGIILKTAIFFFLFPVPLLKETVLSRVKIYLPPATAGPETEGSWVIDPKYTINLQQGQIFLGSGVVLIYLFAGCMAVLVTVVVAKRLRQYAMIHRTYLSDAFTQAPPPQWEDLLRQTKEELRVRKKVKLICSKLCDTPITIGVFFPTVILPCPGRLALGPEGHRCILKHELMHIKNRDLLAKFLTLFALVVHWYNPICHLLYHELCVVSELECDYAVVKDLDDAQCKQYSNLVVDLSTAGAVKEERYAVGLVNNDKAAYKRRILEMKNAKKTRKPLLSGVVMAAVLVMGTVTAFAYEPPTKADFDEFGAEFEGSFSTHVESEEIDYSSADGFFTDEDGNIISLDESNPRLFCKHDFIDGIISLHKRNDDGSCVTKKYNGKRCSVCGEIRQGDLISRLEYVVCPH